MISASDLSYLGLCQVAFLLNKKAKIVTHAMMAGAKRHNKLFLLSDVITEDQMLEKITNGEKFIAREIRVEHPKGGIRGRIDELEFLGHNHNKKNEAIIKDDKFSSSKFLGMNDAHRIQLASYAFMIPEDQKFRNLVEVAGAAIKFRSFDSANSTEFKVGGKQLMSWVNEIPQLVVTANDILANKLIPEPLSFSSIDASWLSVPRTGCASCKYNRICNVGRKMLSNQ
ncbi:MAG: PD-(D/E)XK nuclease family protein [Candidatus Aenigmatarchaeota archaeon]